MMSEEMSPLTLSWVAEEEEKKRMSLTTSPSSTLMTAVRMPPPRLPGVRRRPDVLLSGKKKRIT